MNLTMLRNCNIEEIELILADKDDPIINLLLDKVHEAETKVNESVEKLLITVVNVLNYMRVKIITLKSLFSWKML